MTRLFPKAGKNRSRSIAAPAFLCSSDLRVAARRAEARVRVQSCAAGRADPAGRRVPRNRRTTVRAERISVVNGRAAGLADRGGCSRSCLCSGCAAVGAEALGRIQSAAAGCAGQSRCGRTRISTRIRTRGSVGGSLDIRQELHGDRAQYTEERPQRQAEHAVFQLAVYPDRDDDRRKSQQDHHSEIRDVQILRPAQERAWPVRQCRAGALPRTSAR